MGVVSFREGNPRKETTRKPGTILAQATSHWQAFSGEWGDEALRATRITGFSS